MLNKRQGRLCYLMKKNHPILLLVRYSIYRSIAILAKIRYRYLVVLWYFNIFCIKRPLFDTFDTFDTYVRYIESIRRRRCKWATSLSMTSLFRWATISALCCLTWFRRGCLKNAITSNVNCFLKLYCRVSLYSNCFLCSILA